MRQTLRYLATVGVLGALVAVAPRAATADEYQGRWFGGVDLGVMQPLNALDRYVQTGGSLAPFVGYKFFDDKDLQLNLGLMGELQMIGGGASSCTGCVRASTTTTCGRSATWRARGSRCRSDRWNSTATSSAAA